MQRPHQKKRQPQCGIRKKAEKWADSFLNGLKKQGQKNRDEKEKTAKQKRVEKEKIASALKQKKEAMTDTNLESQENISTSNNESTYTDRDSVCSKDIEDSDINKNN